MQVTREAVTLLYSLAWRAANTGCVQIDTWQVKEAAGEKYLAERSGRGGGDKTESGKEVSRYSLRSRARRRDRMRARERQVARAGEVGRAQDIDRAQEKQVVRTRDVHLVRYLLILSRTWQDT